MIRPVAFALLTLLAACGGPRTAPPVTLSENGFPVPLRANFEETDPHDGVGDRPFRYAVHGIDASRWNFGIDWPTARANGVSFAWLKATEGGDLLDPNFESYFDGARRAGVIPGAYHFFYFCTPAAVQAQWFIRNVPRTRGSLPPVLDLEWNHLSPTCRVRPPPAVVQSEAKIFLDTVARHYGQRPVIYTTPDFWSRNDIAQLGEETWLRSVAAPVEDIYPGARWSFWQYTATGIVPGIEGKVDLNAFSGSAADWQRWLAARTLR